METLDDGNSETKSFTISSQKEMDALLKNHDFLVNDVITLVEVVMDRYDAPRLLEENVAVANKMAAQIEK